MTMTSVSLLGLDKGKRPFRIFLEILLPPLPGRILIKEYNWDKRTGIIGTSNAKDKENCKVPKTSR